MKKSLEDDPQNILRLWERLNIMLSFFFSVFVFREVNDLVPPLEAGLVSLSIFCAYVVIDTHVRAHISEIWSVRGNTAWQKVIVAFMDFVYSLGIFILIQYFLLLLESNIEEADLSISEKLELVYAIILFMFVVYQNLKTLTE